MQSRLRARVTERGQVTIPKRLRDRLGIRAGETLEFDEAEGGRLVARKAAERDPLDAAYGVLAGGGATDELVESLRGEPDAT